MVAYDTIDKEIELAPTEIVRDVEVPLPPREIVHDFEVTLPPPPHVLIAIHGMRDDPSWASQIINDLGYFNDTIIIAPINYGRLNVIDFLLGRLDDWIDEFILARIADIHRRHPNSPLSIMCHSNGTKSLARVIGKLTIPIEYVFLCGSICHYRDVTELTKVQRRPINDCGLRDPWPIVAATIRPNKFSATGVSGFHSFPVIDRQFGFSHAGALTKKHFDHWILPTIIEGKVRDTRRKRTDFLFHLPTYARIMLILAIIAALLLAFWTQLHLLRSNL
jgi:hypothetical protein